MPHRILKMIHWKALLILIIAGFAVRWSLKRQQTSMGVTTAPPQEVEIMEEPASQVVSLVFDQDPVAVNPKPEDEQIETTFTFTNKSSKPVSVTGLESTCSCLEASLDKAIYAPGERGTGKALFKVSSFVGRHEKALHIYTDDPAAPDQVVNFVLDVPEVVSIEPRLLEWTVGEEPAAKEMTIKMLGGDEMRITSVTATRENVTFEWKEVRPGREYRVIVKPTGTNEITIGALKIETDSKIPKYARQMAFFNIVRPELAEKKAAARQQQAGTK